MASEQGQNPRTGQKISLRREPRLDPRHEAFQFQVEAVEALRDLEYGAIFHEQGLGKTKIALDLSLHWLTQRAVDTVLVVAKKGLVENWKREISTHSYLTPRLLTQDRKANFYAFNSPSRLMLTHYEAVMGEKERMELFLRCRNVAVILDEATKIKNPQARLTQTFHELAPLFVRRVIMTGTPVANRPEDIWAQVFFLDLGESLGRNFSDFRSRADLSNELDHDEDRKRLFETQLQAIERATAAFSVRETKDGGVITLPQKVVHEVITEWETVQRELYCEIRDELKAVVIRSGVPTEDNAEVLLKRLLRLVQVASNPLLVDQGYAGTPGKLPYLDDLLTRIINNDEKAIVWTSFVQNVDWLAEQLRRFGVCRIHGKMDILARNRAVDRFMTTDDCRLLIATPQSAKEGLTLTAANHVVFYDRGFSLDDYLQAQDRIHRISQTKKCHVHNLIMPDSIDQWVTALLHAKHTAAQLAQGDVTLEDYEQQMSYDFGSMLHEVLGIDR